MGVEQKEDTVEKREQPQPPQKPPTPPPDRGGERWRNDPPRK